MGRAKLGLMLHTLRIVATMVPLTLASCAGSASAQTQPAPPSKVKSQTKQKQSNPTAGEKGFEERLATTQGRVRIDGSTVRYLAYSGTLPLQGKDRKPDAEVFYVAYHREDVKNLDRRPITFVFNGGPGSSAVWLHLGTFGPRRVAFPDAVTPPPPPYNIVDNPYSILDESDLVFIDPVGTGYSRTVDDGEAKDFLGLKEDIDAVGEFIRLYTTRTGRWNSPKFLAGESYGTTRAAGLVAKLQDQGMFFNGVILISAVLNFQTLAFPPGSDLSYILFFPSYVATAAYHKKVLLGPGKTLSNLIDQARNFARHDYTLALMQGARLKPAQKLAVAKRMSELTGLSVNFILEHNLRISPGVFRKELTRDLGFSIGRLDARYVGVDATMAGTRPDQDPSYRAIQGPYTAAMNHYLHRELKASVDHRYEILSFKVNRAWKWPSRGYADVSGDLARAMRTNPHLQVYVANGYYDLATPFFATEYTADHLAIPDSLRVNLSMGYFESGHMMYLHNASLKKLKQDISTLFSRARRTAKARTKP